MVRILSQTRLFQPSFAVPYGSLAIPASIGNSSIRLPRLLRSRVAGQPFRLTRRGLGRRMTRSLRLVNRVAIVPVRCL